MVKRSILAALSVLASSTLADPLPAQAPAPICACSTQADFGGCLISAAVNSPTTFPGSPTVVAGNIGGQDLAYLYIADLFNGFTYRYDLRGSNGVLLPTSTPELLFSPAGSSSTSGLAFNPIDGLLYWAIEDRLVRTGLDVDGITDLGRIQLTELRTRLGLPQASVLGGITFHQARGSFWGVDIVNDVYFEFDETGRLVEEEGQPVHFLSPARSPYGGGSYGNSIAYVNLNGISYFDVPVGALVDGGVTQVVRVHASEGGEGDEAFEIGDPSGLFFEVATPAGAHDFISGIAYWPSTCGTDQNTEILLGIAPAGSTTPSRIYQISADDPRSATLSEMSAVAVANTVNLSWTAPEPYGRLELSRRLASSTAAPVVLQVFSSYAQDPREYLDRNVGDGLYEYIAKVTPPAPSLRKFPDVKRKVIVGQGSIATHATYLNSTRLLDSDPFAATYIGSSQRLLVADRRTGHAHLFQNDLTQTGTIPGPFVSQALTGGRTVGVAWIPGENAADPGSLLWVLETSAITSLQRTSLTSVPIGGIVPIDLPFNLNRPPLVGDLAWDAFRKESWGVDRINLVAYSFDALGNLTGSSATQQLPLPRNPNGSFDGGVTVVESDASHLVLDYGVSRLLSAPGEKQRISNELVRVSYNRIPAGFSLPGTETLAFDLRTILQATETGGIVAIKEGEDSFAFVVGVDTRTIYKLRMDSGLRGKEFKRGEVNNDGGAPNISDPIAILNYLFKGGPALPCEDAADMNDDERIELSDAVYLFNYLFRRGPAPADPFAACGRDFDPPLLCLEASCS